MLKGEAVYKDIKLSDEYIIDSNLTKSKEALQVVNPSRSLVSKSFNKKIKRIGKKVNIIVGIIFWLLMIVDIPMSFKCNNTANSLSNKIDLGLLDYESQYITSIEYAVNMDNHKIGGYSDEF